MQYTHGMWLHMSDAIRAKAPSCTLEALPGSLQEDGRRAERLAARVTTRGRASGELTRARLPAGRGRTRPTPAARRPQAAGAARLQRCRAVRPAAAAPAALTPRAATRRWRLPGAGRVRQAAGPGARVAGPGARARPAACTHASRCADATAQLMSKRSRRKLWGEGATPECFALTLGRSASPHALPQAALVVRCRATQTPF